MESASAVDNLQIKGLQDQLTLYKRQVKELREVDDKKAKQLQKMSNEICQLKEEKESLSTQLKSALTMVDSEELARSIAKEQISNLEQEKTMIKLEVKEKGTQISRLKELNQLLTDNLDRGTSEKNELNSKIKSLQEELKSLKKKLDSERTLRIQAADKLAELMHRKDRELRMQRVDRSCNCWHSSDDF
ncbi:rho-associated protein kinase 1-like [Oculina patagonica]